MPTICALEHPHLVEVYSLDEDQGEHLMAMEYIVGGTLARLLTAQRPLPLPAVCTIVRHTAAALDHIHDRGLIHGNVKPGNIFLHTTPERSGRVKLGDLGLAGAARSGSVETQSRLMAGTARYMSPEQARGEAPDARSDVYALGVVTYELLTGQVPFRSENIYGYIQSHIQKPPPPLTWFNPDVSPDVQDVVLQALAKDPARRFPSAGAFARSLAAAAARPFQPAAFARAPRSRPKSRGGGPGPWALGLFGLAAVLACAAMLVLGALIAPGVVRPASVPSAPAGPGLTGEMPTPAASPMPPGETPGPPTSIPMSTPSLPLTQAAVSLHPANGPSGTRVLVQGNGFTPNDVVLLTWDGHVVTPTEPAHVVVDTSGRFQVSFYAPTDGWGGHTITAGTAHETATATFTITADTRPTGTPESATQ